MPRKAISLLIVCLSTSLSGCSAYRWLFPEQDSAPSRQRNIDRIEDAKPQRETRSKYGNPHSYVVSGHRYYVLPTAKGYHKRGIASWYGTKFNGHLTSNRERYDMWAMTAASRELPIPCYVQVTNLQNNQQVIVRVNDRGPFHANRIMDLSYAAARKLGITGKGTAWVDVQAIDPDEDEYANHHLLHQHPNTYLQVGAYKDYHNARDLRHRLLVYTNMPVHVIPKTIKSPYYRVEIGPFYTQTQLANVRHYLATHGLGHPSPVTHRG